jgi:hypothetical protein
MKAERRREYEEFWRDRHAMLKARAEESRARDEARRIRSEERLAAANARNRDLKAKAEARAEERTLRRAERAYTYRRSFWERQRDRFIDLARFGRWIVSAVSIFALSYLVFSGNLPKTLLVTVSPFLCVVLVRSSIMRRKLGRAQAALRYERERRVASDEQFAELRKRFDDELADVSRIVVHVAQENEEIDPEEMSQEKLAGFILGLEFARDAAMDVEGQEEDDSPVTHVRRIKRHLQLVETSDHGAS